MKNSRSHRTLMGLFLALVPASDVQAQSVGPDYTVPPSIEYGPLFRDVQLRAIFPDSKTFPDLIPHGTPQSILRNYATARHAPDFDLARFVNTNFSGPVPPGPAVSPAGHGETLATYVASLWPVLTELFSSLPPFATLLPLPYPYVVPGGRFREVYYWDSYFTMLGLEQSGKHTLAVDMLKDFAFEIDRYAHIPNGNRSYYLSRSQPPFFALMVRGWGPPGFPQRRAFSLSDFAASKNEQGGHWSSCTRLDRQPSPAARGGRGAAETIGRSGHSRGVRGAVSVKSVIDE